MNDLNESLGSGVLGAAWLAAVGREQKDCELVWEQAGATRRLLIKGGRPELAVDEHGLEKTTRQEVVAAVRAFAVAGSGQMRRLPLSRPIGAGLRIDTLGEVAVALMRVLSPEQVQAWCDARATQRTQVEPSFAKLAVALHSLGGAELPPSPPGAVLAELFAAASLPARRTLLALVMLGGLSTVPAPDAAPPTPELPSVATPAAASLPASAPAAAPVTSAAQALVTEIEQAYARLESQSFYDVLGVSAKADAAQIQAAYFAAAKRWHSDRFAGASLGEETARHAEALFRQAAEAYRVLGDAKERATYDFVLERRAQGLPTDISVILEAEGLFRKAQALVRRGLAPAAEPLLRQAVELNKGEAEFWAYLGFAIYGAQGKAGLTEARQVLQKAAEMNPKLDATYEFLGRIARVEGQTNEAQTQLKKALALNPKNVEAERELRLLAMRNAKEAAGPKSGGVLSSLFKR